MRNYFPAISTAFAAIYSPSIFAASGCVVIDGKTYELNLASMPIDPDVDVGTVLYTARVDTSGPKLTCPLNTARGKYSSQMLGSFQTLVGTNAYGNIYASGIDGIGIQIRDLEQSAKAVPYETSMDSGALYYWSTDKKDTNPVYQNRKNWNWHKLHWLSSSVQVRFLGCCQDIYKDQGGLDNQKLRS
ncbi:hypothetical protein LNN94_01415 [Klebsiella pneumoniae subsp. pneumoniae]|nr:hypothetical protein [Klebsiella pneumoniae subsp. pneumoniae]